MLFQEDILRTWVDNNDLNDGELDILADDLGDYMRLSLEAVKENLEERFAAAGVRVVIV